MTALAAFTPLASTIAQEPASAIQQSDYRVGAGDVLKITVYRAPDYDSVVQIADDGSIAFSVIGKIAVAGLTPSAVALTIADRLRSQGIFKSPVVNVLVQEYHSRTVSILGNVAKPGEYPLERGGLRVSDLLARAGATVGEATSTVRLTSRVGKIEEISSADIVSGQRDRAIVPGEMIFVTTPPVFYISGEVQRAGSYPIEPGLTVGRAIALAGGLTARGSRNKVKITRKDAVSDAHVVQAKTNDLILPKDLLVVGARIF